MDLSSLTNLAALTSGGGAPTAEAGAAFSSLMNDDAQKQALLRALAATAMGPAPSSQQQQPAHQPPSVLFSQNEGALRALSATNMSAAAPPAAIQSSTTAAVATNSTSSSSNNNNSAENALLLLLQAQQQQHQQAPPPPPAAPMDLQGLARMRVAATGLEGLLASLQQQAAAPAPPPPPPQPRLGDYDLAQLRAAITANPARNGTELLEQARLLSAINSHQQALASVGEAERRLAILLGGRTAPPAPPAANNALMQAEALVQAATAVSAAAAGPAAAKDPAPSPPAQPPAAAPNQNDTTKMSSFMGQMEMGETPKCSPCLPPVEEGNTPHYSQRVIVPLGMQEDANWLSERQCFIRFELLEVVRASHEEVLVRSSSKSIAYQQVGIRCRYCAHLQAGSRAIRASAFPSSIRQMYQSFTMMVRDHFSNCVGVPADKKQRFLKLKGLTSPSSSLSRQYWTFAAKKLGMRDSEYGIMINEETQAEAKKIPPFGTSAEETAAIQAAKVEPMVDERDQNSISPYLFFLMSQAQVVNLLPSERVGKRKDAAVGLPGFGCTHCAKAGRLGFCRMFPLNKRSLPDKVNDLYNHMVRCPMCPRMTQRLIESRRTEQETNRIFAERDRDFIDRIWIKLGRDQDEAFKKN